MALQMGMQWGVRAAGMQNLQSMQMGMMGLPMTAAQSQLMQVAAGMQQTPGLMGMMPSGFMGLNQNCAGSSSSDSSGGSDSSSSSAEGSPRGLKAIGKPQYSTSPRPALNGSLPADAQAELALFSAAARSRSRSCGAAPPQRQRGDGSASHPRRALDASRARQEVAADGSASHPRRALDASRARQEVAADGSASHPRRALDASGARQEADDFDMEGLRRTRMARHHGYPPRSEPRRRREGSLDPYLDHRNTDSAALQHRLDMLGPML